MYVWCIINTKHVWLKITQALFWEVFRSQSWKMEYNILSNQNENDCMPSFCSNLKFNQFHRFACQFTSFTKLTWYEYNYDGEENYSYLTMCFTLQQQRYPENHFYLPLLANLIGIIRVVQNLGWNWIQQKEAWLSHQGETKFEPQLRKNIHI